MICEKFWWHWQYLSPHITRYIRGQADKLKCDFEISSTTPGRVTTNALDYFFDRARYILELFCFSSRYWALRLRLFLILARIGFHSPLKSPKAAEESALPASLSDDFITAFSSRFPFIALIYFHSILISFFMAWPNRRVTPCTHIYHHFCQLRRKMIFICHFDDAHFIWYVGLRERSLLPCRCFSLRLIRSFYFGAYFAHFAPPAAGPEAAKFGPFPQYHTRLAVDSMLFINTPPLRFDVLFSSHSGFASSPPPTL